MNKKYAILAIVLIGLMSFALIPRQASGYNVPPPANTNYVPFGPAASKLVMLVYTDPTAEFAAFQSGEIDFMDGLLTPTDYSAISSNPAYALAGPIGVFSLYEYDINCAVQPLNFTAYRQGLTCLIDRVSFVSTNLAGSAAAAWDPCASIGWGNPALVGEYPAASYIAAYVYFCKALGPPTVDTTPNGFVGGQTDYQASGYYSTWNFISPYPGSGTLSDGAPECMNSHITIYARTTGADAAARTQQGVYLEDQAVFNMPTYFSSSINQAALNTSLQTAFGSGWKAYAIPRVGGNLYLPRIDIDDYPEPRTNTATWVMTDYNFMLYTGGWSLAATPDVTLQTWLSTETPAAKGYVPGVPNYLSYVNTAYDNYVELLMSSPNTGVAATYAHDAENIIMGDAAMITMWYDSGYTATLSSENNVISAVGVGFNNWWSYFDGTPGTNAYITSPGYSSKTFYYGWSSDFQNLNPISSQWVWDWYLMGVVYDSMVGTNPYDVTQIIPSLASDYSYNANSTQTGWAYGTVVNVTLRTDVWWQNVPYMDRSAFTPNGGTELNGPFQNYQLNPLDVAFTMYYMKSQDLYSTTWNGPLVDDVDHVAVNPIYNATGSFAQQQAAAAAGTGWPYWNTTAYPNGPQWENDTWITSPSGDNVSTYSYQNNFVTFDPTVPTNGIKIYLTDFLTWLVYYRDLAVPILPYHIFEWLPTGIWKDNGFTTKQDTTDKFENPNIVAGGMDLLYGTGPYILASGTAASEYTLIANVPGATWTGGGGQPMTETYGYFWNSPVRVADEVLTDPVSSIQVGITGTKLLADVMLENFNPITGYTGTVTGTFSVYDTVTHTITPYSGSATYSIAAAPTPPPVTPSFTSVYVVCPGLPFNWNRNLRILSFTYQVYVTGNLVPVDVGMYNPNVVLNEHPGDIAGATVTFPYLGSDGVCDATDLFYFGQWFGTSYVPGSINPTSTQARCDINGDGSIDASDLYLFGLSFGAPAWS